MGQDAFERGDVPGPPRKHRGSERNHGPGAQAPGERDKMHYVQRFPHCPLSGVLQTGFQCAMCRVDELALPTTDMPWTIQRSSQ